MNANDAAEPGRIEVVGSGRMLVWWVGAWPADAAIVPLPPGEPLPRREPAPRKRLRDPARAACQRAVKAVDRAGLASGWVARLARRLRTIADPTRRRRRP
jgi:hypothetical protein